MISYILYKNPIQTDTLNIVQYLYFLGIPIIPKHCIERNHPNWAFSLPSIETETNDKYIGFDECIKFYEKESGIDNLYYKALIFKINNPSFRINS
jgi:hypothetical protein